MDMGEIGLAINDRGAVVTLKAIGKATDELSEAEKRQNAVLTQLARANLEVQSARKQEQTALRGLNQAQREQARMVIEAQGGMQRYLEIQKAITRETQAATAAKTRNVVALTNITTTTNGATLSTGRLGNSFGSLAAQLTGFHPIVSNVAGVLATFAVGSALTVGILAGAAAIALAWDRMTKSAREAREETKKLIDELVRQGESRFLGTPEGQQVRLKRLADEFKAAQTQLQQAQGGRAFGSVQGGGLMVDPAQVTAAQANIARVMASIREAGASLGEVLEANASKAEQRLREAEAKRKKAASEAAAEADKHLTNLIRRATEAGHAIGQLASGGFSFAGGLDLKPIGIPTNAIPGQSGAFVNLGGIGGLTGSSFAVPQGLGGPSAQTYQQRQQVEQWNFVLMGGLAVPVKKAGAEVNKMAEVTKFAAQSIATSASNFVIGRVSGGTFGGTIGGGVGQAGASMLGGFGGTALGQAVFAPILSGVGAALGNAAQKFAEDLFGGGKAARLHAEALQVASRAIAASIADFHAEATGTVGSLDDQIRKAHERAQALRDEAKADAERRHAFVIWGNPADRAAYEAQIAQINADEIMRIARLREADAIKAATEAVNAFTTSMRNAPTGFKVEPYVNRFAAAKPWDYPGPTINTPFRPQGGPTGTAGGIGRSGTSLDMRGATFNLTLPNVTKPEQVGPAFMQYLRRVASGTTGNNAPLAEALDYA